MSRRPRWLRLLGGTVFLAACLSRPAAAETWALTGSLVQSRCPLSVLNGEFAAAGVLQALREGETLTALGSLAAADGRLPSRISVTLRGVVRGDAFDGSVRFLGPAGMRGRGRASGVLSPAHVSVQLRGAREERSGCDLGGEFTGTISR